MPKSQLPHNHNQKSKHKRNHWLGISSLATVVVGILAFLAYRNRQSEISSTLTGELPSSEYLQNAWQNDYYITQEKMESDINSVDPSLLTSGRCYKTAVEVCSAYRASAVSSATLFKPADSFISINDGSCSFDIPKPCRALQEAIKQLKIELDETSLEELSKDQQSTYREIYFKIAANIRKVLPATIGHQSLLTILNNPKLSIKVHFFGARYSVDAATIPHCNTIIIPLDFNPPLGHLRQALHNELHSLSLISDNCQAIEPRTLESNNGLISVIKTTSPLSNAVLGLNETRLSLIASSFKTGFETIHAYAADILVKGNRDTPKAKKLFRMLASYSQQMYHPIITKTEFSQYRQVANDQYINTQGVKIKIHARHEFDAEHWIIHYTMVIHKQNNVSRAAVFFTDMSSLQQEYDVGNMSRRNAFEQWAEFVSSVDSMLPGALLREFFPAIADIVRRSSSPTSVALGLFPN